MPDITFTRDDLRTYAAMRARAGQPELGTARRDMTDEQLDEIVAMLNMRPPARQSGVVAFRAAWDRFNGKAA